MLVRQALREAGIGGDVQVLDDGEQMMARIAGGANAEIDLLILDMHLPKRDGAEILRHMSANERYARTPVIVMTGSDAPEHASMPGEARYFRKPSSLAAFMELGAVARSMLKKPAGREPDGAPAERDETA